MIKCISFDFDHTLGTVTPFTHHFIPELLKQYGYNVSITEFKQACKDLRDNIPENLKDRFIKFGTLPNEERINFLREYNKTRIDFLHLKCPPDDLEKLKNKVIEELLAKQKRVLYSDVYNTIIKLKKMNYKIYIVSGNHSDGIIDLLKNANLLSYFEELITVDRFKPNKIDNYEFLLNHAKVKPEEILHIGDEVKQDGYVPSKYNIQVLILRRKDELTFDDDSQHNFPIINQLNDIFTYLKKGRKNEKKL